MGNALVLAAYAGPVYVLLGLSVLLYVPVWQKIMDKWEQDHYTLIPMMMMYFILGLLMVRMYNVWEWNVWLLVTLTGWILILKSVLYFLLPGSVLKAALKMKKGKGMLYVGGLVCLIVGLVLSYYAYIMPEIATNIL